MEEYKDMVIRGNSVNLIEKLKKVANKNWNITDINSELMTAQYTGDKYIGGTLFIRCSSEELLIDNIIPISNDRLEPLEYNKLLMLFKRNIINRISFGTGIEVLKVNKRKNKFQIDEVNKRLSLLNEWARSSNNITNHIDQERWLAFTVRSFKMGSVADYSKIFGMLLEEEWPVVIAIDLAVQYKFVIDLLMKYRY